MSIKSIMVPLNGVDESAVALAVAIEVGRRFDARVSVRHTALDPNKSIPYLGEGMTGAMVEDVMTAVEKEADERSKRAAAQFAAACEAADVTAAEAPMTPGFAVTYDTVVGREEDIVAEQGRLHDLVVTGRAGPDSDVIEPAALQAAITETGRAVLVAPLAEPAGFGRTVAVAWNGSAQAARAMSSGLPFLATADRVTVMAVDEPERRGPPAEDAAGFLAAHGVSADVKHVTPGADGIGEALLRDVKAANCDMLIMGAYTHARLRQLILGGVTRGVLANTEIPVLMAH